jgi:hypothetical protein
VDVYTELKDQGWLFADESHFTDEGHQVAASLLAIELLPFFD